MTKFTVWVMQSNREGTCHISAHEADTMEEAANLALEETSADWNWDIDDLFVLGIASGDVTILEWNDE